MVPRPEQHDPDPIYHDAVTQQDDGGGLLAQVVTSDGMNLGLSTMDPSDGQTYWGWNMQATACWFLNRARHAASSVAD